MCTDSDEAREAQHEGARTRRDLLADSARVVAAGTRVRHSRPGAPTRTPHQLVEDLLSPGRGTRSRMRRSLPNRAGRAGADLELGFDRAGPVSRRPRFCSATEGAMPRELAAHPRATGTDSCSHVHFADRVGAGVDPLAAVPRLKGSRRRGYWSARRAAVWSRLPRGRDWSSRPSALQTPALTQSLAARVLALGPRRARIPRIGGASARTPKMRAA